MADFYQCRPIYKVPTCVLTKREEERTIGILLEFEEIISRGSSSLTGNTGLTIEGHASLLIIMNCHHIQPHGGEKPKHHHNHDHQVHIETSEGLWFWSRRTGGGHSRGGGLITISIIIISIITIYNHHPHLELSSPFIIIIPIYNHHESGKSR